MTLSGLTEDSSDFWEPAPEGLGDINWIKKAEENITDARVFLVNDVFKGDNSNETDAEETTKSDLNDLKCDKEIWGLPHPYSRYVLMSLSPPPTLHCGTNPVEATSTFASNISNRVARELMETTDKEYPGNKEWVFYEIATKLNSRTPKSDDC